MLRPAHEEVNVDQLAAQGGPAGSTRRQRGAAPRTPPVVKGIPRWSRAFRWGSALA